MLAHSSPWIFAVRCVLLRRLMPRHSPYALTTLTFSSSLLSPLFVKEQIQKSPEAPKCFRADELKFGGGERDRTDDPLLAKQVLSQLSYTPVVQFKT